MLMMVLWNEFKEHRFGDPCIEFRAEPGAPLMSSRNRGLVEKSSKGSAVQSWNVNMRVSFDSEQSRTLG